LPKVINPTEKFASVQSVPNKTIQSVNAGQSTDSNLKLGGIVRKCEICFSENDGSYQNYVLHALKEHNPNAVKSFVKEPYILDAILEGGVFKKKTCDICKEEISFDVFDYINHIQKNHKELINKSLKTRVADEFVISVLLNNNASSSQKSQLTCHKCRKEVEADELKNHIMQHKLEKQAFKNANGTNSGLNNQQLNSQNNTTGVSSNLGTNNNVLSQNQSSINTNPNLNPSTKKTTFKCNKCEKEVLFKDMKVHNLLHDQEKLSNATNKISNISANSHNPTNDTILQQNTSSNKVKNEKNLDNNQNTNSSHKSSVVCHQCGKDVEYKDLKEHNSQHKQEKKTLKNNIDPIQPVGGSNQYRKSDSKSDIKLNLQPSNAPSNQQVKDNDTKNSNTADKKSTVECFKCGKEIAYQDLKEHKLSHKQHKLGSKNLTAPLDEKNSTKPTDSKPNTSSSSNDESKFQNKQKKEQKIKNNSANTNPSEINLNNQDMITNLVNLLTQKTNSNNNININFNINNNNQISTNVNTTTNNNSTITSDNSEEIKELQEQFQNMKLKFDSLEALQSQNAQEYKNLQNLINQKMADNNFKMSDIEKELKRLSELESQMKETNDQINQIKSMKDEYDQKFSNQDKQIKNLEEKLTSKIEDLEKQYKFLNSQKDDMFVDKFNEVEKQLNKLKLEYAVKSNSDVDFSVPTTWKPQTDNLKLVEVDRYSQEFTQLSEMFLKTMPNSTIKKITRIQNSELWKNFCFAKYQLSKKGNSTSKLLFHGTRQTDPALIYEGKEEGFDMRFANTGFFGTGIYFHEKASYSHGYRYSTYSSTSSMFIAEVLIGEIYKSPTNSSLKMPPFKNETKKIRYDCVKADYDEMYIIYNNMRAYPSYLLEYR